MQVVINCLISDVFLEISSYIKNQVGMFSYLKSYHRFVVAATLDIHFTDYKEAFRKFLDLYEQLVTGALAGVYLLISQQLCF